RRVHPAFVAVLLSTLTMLSSASVLAATKTVTVRTGDLNLATEAGRATLQRRIARAVEHICGSPYRVTLADLPAYDKCSRPAMDGAMSQYATAVAAAEDAAEVA